MVYKYGERVKRSRRVAKKYVIGAISTIIMAGGMALPAMAAGPGNGPPPATPNSCDAGHGAPGGYGPDSPYWVVPGPQGGVGGYRMGQAQGVVTGQWNSDYSASCNQS